MADTLIDGLSKIWLFKGLAQDDLVRLSQLAKSRVYRARETIVSKGGPAGEFYVLLRGRAKVTAQGKEGADTAINVMGPGEVFGEIGTLHADVRPGSPAKPGREARRDNEYGRRGTANVFCAVEPKAGRHFTFPTANRPGFEFARVMLELALAYPDAKTIHLVMDNLSTHRRKALTDAFGEETGGQIWDRFTVHYTPVHGSWLNQAEIEISLLSRQCLGKRRIPALGILVREVRAWTNDKNRSQTKINWTFDRKAARRKFGYRKNFSKRSKT